MEPGRSIKGQSTTNAKQLLSSLTAPSLMLVKLLLQATHSPEEFDAAICNKI